MKYQNLGISIFIFFRIIVQLIQSVNLSSRQPTFLHKKSEFLQWMQSKQVVSLVGGVVECATNTVTQSQSVRVSLC